MKCSNIPTPKKMYFSQTAAKRSFCSAQQPKWQQLTQIPSLGHQVWARLHCFVVLELVQPIMSREQYGNILIAHGVSWLWFTSLLSFQQKLIILLQKQLRNLLFGFWLLPFSYHICSLFFKTYSLTLQLLSKSYCLVKNAQNIKQLLVVRPLNQILVNFT